MDRSYIFGIQSPSTEVKIKGWTDICYSTPWNAIIRLNAFVRLYLIMIMYILGTMWCDVLMCII